VALRRTDYDHAYLEKPAHMLWLGWEYRKWANIQDSRINRGIHHQQIGYGSKTAEYWSTLTNYRLRILHTFTLLLLVISQ